MSNKTILGVFLTRKKLKRKFAERYIQSFPSGENAMSDLARFIARDGNGSQAIRAAFPWCQTDHDYVTWYSADKMYRAFCAEIISHSTNILSCFLSDSGMVVRKNFGIGWDGTEKAHRSAMTYSEWLRHNGNEVTAIQDAFHWNLTEQGHEYWQAINDDYKAYFMDYITNNIDIE